MLRLAAIALLAVCHSAYGILGPSCVAQKKRGSAGSITGQVAAGEIVSHRVAYATEGSQNDVRFSWTGESSADGPRLTLYATKVGCEAFSLPPESNTGECASLGRAGRLDIGVVSTLIVTHGRGNPERFGTPPEYKLWVVGDPERFAGYTINITWFYGPDC